MSITEPKPTDEKPIQWLTTAPHPNHHKWKTCEVDAGQRGWRTHAVRADDKETLEVIARRRSLCGLKPSHGWGVDLFIDLKCSRCERIAKANHQHAMTPSHPTDETERRLNEIRERRKLVNRKPPWSETTSGKLLVEDVPWMLTIIEPIIAQLQAENEGVREVKCPNCGEQFDSSCETLQVKST